MIIKLCAKISFFTVCIGMSSTNNTHAKIYEISKNHWCSCRICNKNLQDIKKEFGGGNKYFSYAFKDHVQKHNMTIEEYFVKIINLKRPICKCNRCHKEVNIVIRGAKIFWREYACGFYPGTQKWSEEAKTSRLGKNNPMFGKKPWNNGLNLDDPRVESVASKFRGKKLTKEHKEKLSKAYNKNIIRHAIPHSEETKQKLRTSTLNLIKRGVFNQLKSKPHIAMSVILDELGLTYEEEKIHGHFSFDFWLKDLDVYIEVDGDYFHSNPKFYPNGPESKTQKINYTRDCSKNKYAYTNNMMLLRFWESDIINSKEKVICTLKQLKI